MSLAERYTPSPVFEPIALPRTLPPRQMPSFIGDNRFLANWLFYRKGANRLWDFSGNGNHGTIHGGKWVDGHWGWALYTNGSNDYVEQPQRVDINPATIVIWMSPKSAIGSATEIFFGARDTDRFMWQNYAPYESSHWGWKIGGDWYRFEISDPWPSDWVMVTLTWNGATGREELYWNTSSKGSLDTFPGGMTLTCPPFIGARNEAGVVDSHAEADFGHILISDTEFFDVDVEEIFNATSFMYGF